MDFMFLKSFCFHIPLPLFYFFLYWRMSCCGELHGCTELQKTQLIWTTFKWMVRHLELMRLTIPLGGITNMWGQGSSFPRYRLFLLLFYLDTAESEKRKTLSLTLGFFTLCLLSIFRPFSSKMWGLSMATKGMQTTTYALSFQEPLSLKPNTHQVFSLPLLPTLFSLSVGW